MLKARTWQERGQPYVCAFCRSKLNTRESYLRGRAFSNLSTSNSLPIRLPATTRCLAPHSQSARTLSTTSILRIPNDNGPGSGGFSDGLGGFGVGGFGSGGFGSFGNDAPASSGVTPDADGLLPHEREARAKQKAAAPPPPPPQKKQQNRDSASQKLGQGRAQHDQRSRIRSVLQNVHQNKNRIQDQQKQQQPPVEERKEPLPQHKPLTSALLAEAFRTDRTSKSPPTPKSWTGGQDDAAGISQLSWGSFSAQEVETSFPRIKPDPPPTTAEEPAAQAKQASNTEATRETDEKDGESWGQLKRSSRQKETDASSVKEKGTKKQSSDFWESLDNRVSKFGDKKPSASFEAFLPSSEKETPDEYQTRRNSRFQGEEEEVDLRRGGKKAKKAKKGRRETRYDDEDWDEEASSKWERKQRRKAEKEEAKKAGLAPAEQEAPTILLPEFISVSNLARSLKIQPSMFLNDLEQMGFEELTEDTIMTGDTAALVAMEYGFDPTVDNGSQLDLRPRPVPEDVSTLPSRPPVVTIMGHVDHGKTTLLDWLRKSSIAAQEHGGITQHIGAFIVQMSSGKQITFLDTPGHAAFLSMRQRGANVTDIVVLVVAADDSVMPQTIEALKHARAAKVPIIVAINKCDKEDARIDQVKADLARHSVEIEDYGGDVQVVCVSGKTGQGMEDLEENIVTLSEILDVRAENDGMAEGWVLESSVKQTGKVATVLVKRGTLRPGDYIVAGKSWARIRSLRNEASVEISEAPPGTPVAIYGWRDLPEAGEQVLQAPDEDKAKTAVDYRQEMSEREESSIQLAQQEQRQREKATEEELAATLEEQGTDKEVDGKPATIMQNFIIRADVAGSVEAVRGTVQEIGNHEVQPRVLRSTVGAISEADVDQAAVSNGIIVNFNLPIQPHIRQRADDAKVRIIDHSVIYHVADDVKAALSKLLPPSVTHCVIGEADVLQVFSINIKKRVNQNIAGCRIRNGTIKRGSMVKVLRWGKVVHQGKIDTLKHVKKDVTEMGKGSECGIGLEDFQDLQQDDQIQTFEEIKEKRSL